MNRLNNVVFNVVIQSGIKEVKGKAFEFGGSNWYLQWSRPNWNLIDPYTGYIMYTDRTQGGVILKLFDFFKKQDTRYIEAYADGIAEIKEKNIEFPVNKMINWRET